ncbi:MAG: hypothetical protein ACRC2R_24780 [Xenococcaceae cyanobacterium]
MRYTFANSGVGRLLMRTPSIAAQFIPSWRSGLFVLVAAKT